MNRKDPGTCWICAFKEVLIHKKLKWRSEVRASTIIPWNAGVPGGDVTTVPKPSPVLSIFNHHLYYSFSSSKYTYKYSCIWVQFFWVSWEETAYFSVMLHCVFPKNKDILLCNPSTVSKLRKFNTLIYSTFSILPVVPLMSFVAFFSLQDSIQSRTAYFILLLSKPSCV